MSYKDILIQILNNVNNHAKWDQGDFIKIKIISNKE